MDESGDPLREAVLNVLAFLSEDNVREETLNDLFGLIGGVTEANLLAAQTRMRAFGLVSAETEEAALKAAESCEEAWLVERESKASALGETIARMNPYGDCS